MSTLHFDFDRVIDRRHTGSEKWDRYAGRDIIPLWVADMDFRSPPAVIEALHERVEHGIFGYTHPPAELVEAVQASLLADYDWAVEAEWIVWLPGLVCGLNVLSLAVGEPGDQVITFIPVYPPFMSAPGLTGRTLVKVPLKLEDDRWQMDLPGLELAITPRTRLLLLCSPHNPVGRSWSREELAAIAQVAKRHNLIIGSDDIHAGWCWMRTNGISPSPPCLRKRHGAPLPCWRRAKPTTFQVSVVPLPSSPIQVCAAPSAAPRAALSPM